MEWAWIQIHCKKERPVSLSVICTSQYSDLPNSDKWPIHAVIGQNMYVLYCETYMQLTVIFFKFNSRCISSFWVSQFYNLQSMGERWVIVDQSTTEHQTDLFDLYCEKTSWKQALFLKPVACHLTCNGYAPFSLSSTAGETLWEWCCCQYEFHVLIQLLPKCTLFPIHTHGIWLSSY